MYYLPGQTSSKAEDSAIWEYTGSFGALPFGLHSQTNALLPLIDAILLLGV